MNEHDQDRPGDDQRRLLLDELTRAHRRRLRAVACKLCRSGLDPDDLVQDVLLKAVLHHDTLPQGSGQLAWMIRVMRNLFIDRIRRSRTTEPVDEGHLAAPVTTEPAWWEALTAADVRAALPRLPAEQRAAFELFAFEGLSYKQVAARLGVTAATVGTRVLRARRRLRTVLTRFAGAREEGDEVDERRPMARRWAPMVAGTTA